MNLNFSSLPNRSKRVLAIAYACNPYLGSEHGVGWGWIKMISESFHLDVIVADFEKSDIERWLSLNPEYRSRVNFHFPAHKPWHYHKQSYIWIKIENSALKIIMNFAYRLWQIDAYKLACQLHIANNYDLCHLITYVGFRFPGRFYKLDCPFVWGPIGGLENTPKQILPLLGIYGAVYYFFRNMINTYHKCFLKHPKNAFKKSARTRSIIAATSGIQNEIRRWYGVESSIICEIGPPLIDAIYNVNHRKNGEPLNLCWSGTHTSGKALQLLIIALSRLPKNIEWTLDVLGEGPCTSNWMNLSVELGVDSNCIFHGNLSRINAIRLMRRSHLFIITSLKDLTSTVLMEALYLGKPVIAPDHCGFSDVITSDCGIKIPINNIDQFIFQLADAITFIYENESNRQLLAEGAFERVKDFTWNSKKLKLTDIYMSL